MWWNHCIMIIKELTTCNSLYLSFYMSVLQVFYHHFNIILIPFIDFPCSAPFCGFQLFNFYWILTDWLPQEAGSWCGEFQHCFILVCGIRKQSNFYFGFLMTFFLQVFTKTAFLFCIFIFFFFKQLAMSN